jgi:hypothetical protein
VFRNQNLPVQRPTLGFDPGCGIHGVPAVNDIFFDIADLGGNHRAAVEAGFELGDNPIPCQIPLFGGMYLFHNKKETEKTIALL